MSGAEAATEELPDSSGTLDKNGETITEAEKTANDITNNETTKNQNKDGGEINNDQVTLDTDNSNSNIKTSNQTNEESNNNEEKAYSKSSETPGTIEYDPKNVTYEGDVAIYTDPNTGHKYQWSKDKQEWVPETTMQYGFEDDTHTYTDADGVKYFWDKEKSAWFPKINDEFMAHYQMNYGFIDNTSSNSKETTTKKEEEEKKSEAKKLEMAAQNKAQKETVKRKASEPTWFELNEEQNTKVYVSNLPTDVTEEEFVEFMQKCGLVMQDTSTGKMKIKLYVEPGTDIKKGDALCTYIRKESVDLALKLLDGSDFRGHKLKVEKAKFQMKGEYDPKLKPKMRKRKEKQKLKRMQEKLFDWRPEKLRGERSKHERVVVVRNLFESSMFDKDVGLILEFQQDLREECGKCGTVRKVIIYDRHPEGVAQINMSCPEEADACVQLLNGRWFCKRQITAEIWDGKTKFKIAETDSQISQRLDNWDKFLESDSKPETSDSKTET